ncbi:MAG: ATP-binding protein [Pseudomonadota bacterium]
MTFLQVRFGLKPLRQIGTGLSEIRSGDAERLEGDLPSEIQPLQSELNALIQSNEEIIDRARTQVGNLAHGLKTPLAVITNEAADAKTPFASKVAEQAEFMRTQIAHYLDRARMAAGVKTIGRVTEIEPVAQSLQRALERIYRDKGVNISIDIAQGSKFQGEKQDLEELLGNLLDNACKWCRRKVSLTAKVSSETKHERRVELIVDDDGPGLTAEERAQIVKRGRRLDESKPGSGLGLSIVSDLAALYRGSFTLSEAPNGGLRAVLSLPGA